jgi:multidrug transporter EmrE-like cation transporter
MRMTELLLLIASGTCEALWNMALKKSTGIFDYGINFLAIVFLAGSIVTFKKAIDAVPLSIAMIIWSGVALIFTILLDIYFFKTKIDFKVAFFMGLCIVSIIGLNYYSNK